MKKFVLVVLLVALISIAGCAKEAEARGSKDPCKTPLASILNQCVEHPDNPSEDKQLMPYGVGLDLIILEETLLVPYKVTIEYKYDIRNSEQSLYGVLSLKLKDIINKVKGE